MLTQIQIDKYSDVLLWGLKTARKRGFKKNEVVIVRFNLDALHTAEALQAKLLNMGLHPVLRLGLTSRMVAQRDVSRTQASWP